MRKWLVNNTSVSFFSSPGLLEHDFMKKTAGEKRWSARVSRLVCTRSPQPVDRGRPQCPVSYPDNNSAGHLLGWVCRQRKTVRWSHFKWSFRCAWLKKLQSHRKRKTAKFLLWNRKKQVTVWTASHCCESGDHLSSDRFVSHACEVNSLRWVVGLSFRLSKAISKSSFLSELCNHPSKPGENG